MSNKVKYIGINYRTYYFFDDDINIKFFDSDNIKIGEKPYKNILIYYIGYITIKYSKYVKINSVNFSYLIFSKVNGYFEKVNKNKYLTLVPTNESKVKIKIKIGDLVRSITKGSDEYDQMYIKIKFHLYNDLPLNKTIEILA